MASPFFEFKEGGGCACAQQYNRTAEWFQADAYSSCGERTGAYTTSHCALQATVALSALKKDYWQAELRVAQWRAGSTVTLHWGGIPAKFFSSWNAEKMVDDPFVEWQRGGDWTFKLSLPPKGQAYSYLGVKVGYPLRLPAVSCAAAFPPPAPPASPPPPPPPPSCFEGVSYELQASSGAGFSARIVFTAPWGRGGSAVTLDFAGAHVELERAHGAKVAWKRGSAFTLLAGRAVGLAGFESTPPSPCQLEPHVRSNSHQLSALRQARLLFG